MIVVATDSVDDDPSKQFTTAPFRPLLTGLTVILDTSGKLSLPESLKAVNVALLIVTGGSTPLEIKDEKTAIAPMAIIRGTSHL